MNVLLKWTLIFATFMLAAKNSHAFNIASLNFVNGPEIHTTYFFTTNNQPVNVQAEVYMGNFVNGICQYGSHFNMGKELIRTGNQVVMDAYRLKSIAGGGYNCMTIFYNSTQLVYETIGLQWNGVNYTASYPTLSQVTII
jgi:hypothetical protein